MSDLFPQNRGGHVFHTCPECHGTGFVLVAPTRHQKLFSSQKEWSEIYAPGQSRLPDDLDHCKRSCAICGGDGRIDPEDIQEIPDFDRWYTKDFKERMRRHE